MRTSMRTLFDRFLYVVGGLLFLAGCFFVYFNLPVRAPQTNVAFGMTFSYPYAEALGLDWHETYTALLDDIGIRKMRIPVYWDRTETAPGQYDFAAIDWQVQELGKRQGGAILTVGQRVPRWPECHIPDWVGDDTAKREQALLDFLPVVVNRYKDNPTLHMWQVENEPFLTQFGECPPLDQSFLDKEIALVHSLDPNHPVLVTDSGELSLWIHAAKRGDVFGTTLYRHIYQRTFGYMTYPIGPNFFHFKTWLVKLLTPQRHFIVIELQAEPWVPGWIADFPLEEQFRTMDEHKLDENVQYARAVGFPEVYLWGGEWWYWLKTKKHYNALWDEGKKIFAEPHGASI